jgi:hypothetical protein
VSKNNRNKRNNDDALRSSDIIPLYNMPSAHKVPKEAANAKQQEREIPKFDLAEEIMAEHRKVTSSKRKAPQSHYLIPDTRYRILDTGRELRIEKQQQIIAEIVSKDIVQMCGLSTYEHLTFDI